MWNALQEKVIIDVDLWWPQRSQSDIISQYWYRSWWKKITKNVILHIYNFVEGDSVKIIWRCILIVLRIEDNKSENWFIIASIHLSISEPLHIVCSLLRKLEYICIWSQDFHIFIYFSLIVLLYKWKMTQILITYILSINV